MASRSIAPRKGTLRSLEATAPTGLTVSLPVYRGGTNHLGLRAARPSSGPTAYAGILLARNPEADTRQPLMPDHTQYLDRTLIRSMKTRLLDTIALPALLKATELLGLVLAERLRRYREMGDPERHFVSDQGAQFTATAFRETLAALGIKQRFGAIGKTGSIAIVERFWTSLKDTLCLRLCRHC